MILTCHSFNYLFILLYCQFQKLNNKFIRRGHNLKKALIALIVTTSLMFTSCSSIMNGSKDKVNVASDPVGASIVVNGMKVGQTPAVLQLRRGESHILEISKAGYNKYTVTTGKSITGWLWGNLVCGGLIGFAIDLGTGNGYDVDPDNIIANLDPKGTAQNRNIYIYENFTSLTVQSEKGEDLGQLKIEWID